MNIFFVVSIICFALCLIMFFYLKWYIKKRAPVSEIEEHRAEINKLIVDINSVTDRNLQLVEDSILRLKTLLEETGKRIDEYKNEIQKPSNATLYTSLGHGVRSALKNPELSTSMESEISRVEQPPPTVPLLQSEHPLIPPRQLPLELKTSGLYETSVKAEIKTPKAVPPVQKPSSKKQIRSAIDSLANEGLSPEEIASRLEISIAQVNLAMNLRRTKR
ncbi:MAG: hypothetical protein LBB81_08740 [Treponema sp.]|jgi:hypothetical protein|nr:hypothetical protein [Treponema sp.]